MHNTSDQTESESYDLRYFIRINDKKPNRTNHNRARNKIEECCDIKNAVKFFAPSVKAEIRLERNNQEKISNRTQLDDHIVLCDQFQHHLFLAPRMCRIWFVSEKTVLELPEVHTYQLYNAAHQCVDR